MAARRYGGVKGIHNAGLAGGAVKVLGHARGSGHHHDSAVDLAGGGIIQAPVHGIRRAGHIDLSSVNIQRTVGIQAVTSRIHLEGSSGNVDVICGLLQGFRLSLSAGAHKVKVRIGGAASGGVQAVIRGHQGNVAPGDIDKHCLQALIALGNGDGSPGDAQGVIRVEAVVTGGRLDNCVSCNGHGSGAVEGIIHTVQGDRPPGNQQVSVGFQALGTGLLLVRLVRVKPAGEAKVLRMRRGIGRTAAGGNVQGTPGYVQRRSRLHPVLLGIHRQCDCFRQLHRPLGVEAVLLGRNRDLAVSQKLQLGLRLDSVASRRNIDGSALYADIAQALILVIIGLDPVIAGLDVEAAAGNQDGVLALEAVLQGVDGIDPAGYRHVVLSVNGHVVVAVYGQGACPGKGQVVLGENGRIRLVLIGRKHIVGPIGDGVLRPLRQLQGDKALFHTNRGRGGTGNVRSVQDQANFLVLLCVHQNRAIRQGAGQAIDPRLGDGHAGALCLGPCSLHLDGISLEGNDSLLLGGGFLPGSLRGGLAFLLGTVDLGCRGVICLCGTAGQPHTE